MHTNYYDIPWQPTQSRGILYRSKLESNWSQLFDCLHITYTYESKQYHIPELEHTPEEWFTPDFNLLSCPFNVIEIKPKYPLDSTMLKCASVSSQGLKVALFYGSCYWSQFEIMIFEQGRRREIPVKLVDRLRCKFGVSRTEARKIIGLKYVLGNRDYVKAFKEVMR